MKTNDPRLHDHKELILRFLKQVEEKVTNLNDDRTETHAYIDDYKAGVCVKVDLSVEKTVGGNVYPRRMADHKEHILQVLKETARDVKDYDGSAEELEVTDDKRNVRVYLTLSVGENEDVFEGVGGVRLTHRNYHCKVCCDIPGCDGYSVGAKCEHHIYVPVDDVDGYEKRITGLMSQGICPVAYLEGESLAVFPVVDEHGTGDYGFYVDRLTVEKLLEHRGQLEFDPDDRHFSNSVPLSEIEAALKAVKGGQTLYGVVEGFSTEPSILEGIYTDLQEAINHAKNEAEFCKYEETEAAEGDEDFEEEAL